jgi:hypothetical protein
VDAEYEDFRTLVTRSCLVPLLEGHVTDSAGLADDRRSVDSFDHRIAFQVVVKFLAGVPVPVQLLVRRDLHEVDENLAVGCEIRRKLLVQQVRDGRARRPAQRWHGDTHDQTRCEHGEEEQQSRPNHDDPPIPRDTSMNLATGEIDRRRQSNVR